MPRVEQGIGTQSKHNMREPEGGFSFQAQVYGDTAEKVSLHSAVACGW